MSDRPLPDDPAQWPNDANELLGVRYGVTPRELRRAYNQLIRVYKPEQYPEQFRRIREAYEYLLRFAELFASDAEPSPATPVEPTQTETREQSAVPDSPEWIAVPPRPVEEETSAAPEAARHRLEEIDGLWEMACGGRPAIAYERLAQLVQQQAGRAELYTRLYWLRKLFPEVDARREPADWLVQGLLATGQAGPLRELYREEVADDPDEALSERFERLLDAPLSAGPLADLLEWRIQAAVRRQRWDILEANLERFRARFALDEEQLWLRLLFTLADGVAWARDAAGVRLLEVCRQEIRHHEQFASTMPHSFDRFDLLLEASAGWSMLHDHNHVPVSMLHLLAASWSRPFAEVRGPLMEVLESMARTPQRWLDRLDEMRHRAPATLALFGELLDRFEEVREDVSPEPCEPEVARDLTLAFLPQLQAANYEAERIRLLLFCIREGISPEEMAEVASGFTGGWQELGTFWTRTLLADWSLRHLYRAYRLFWA